MQKKENLPKIGSVVLFLDPKLNRLPDETGYNQIGIVVSDCEILCRRGNRVSRLSKIESANNKCDIYKPVSEQLTANVVEYFSKNIVSSRIFDLGITALLNKAPVDLFDHPLLMPDFKKLPCVDFEQRWNRVEAVVKPGDIVFTYDTESFISKFIANLDKGAWSHVGIYVGDGYICEAITNGVVQRPITEYKNKKIRMGIYRYKGISPEAANDFVDECKSRIGDSYNWWGAIKLGIKMILKIESKKN